MSPEGWIFAFGFRLVYVGLLVVWLIWFLRLRDDDEDPPDDAGDDGGERRGPNPPSGPGGGGLPLPTGRVPAGRRHARDIHPPTRAPRPRRDAPPLPSPLPARVRLPSEAPVRIIRR